MPHFTLENEYENLMFFMNKGKFVELRYNVIKNEMIKRKLFNIEVE